MNKNLEKTFEVKNYIGIFDNYITENQCNKLIDYYKKENEFGKTYQRLQTENVSPIYKKDVSANFPPEDSIQTILFKQFKDIFVNFDLALQRYIKNYGIDLYYSSGFKYTFMKIQKTLPREGFHTFHIEHNSTHHSLNRVLVFSIYLNDVEEGGETEFLYQSVRVKPKTGRIVIWPAAFPFVHRGNPPLSGEKYILTSWINCVID